MTDNHLKEERMTFNMAGIDALTPRQPETKPDQYRGKVFKSGNSLALRLSKGLGLKEGMEMVIRAENLRYIMEPVDAPRRKIDISKFAGKAPWLKELRPEDREIEHRELDWDGALLKRGK